MIGWIGTFSYIAYTLGAIVCALAAVWVARQGDRSRSDRTPAIVALALTANWCFASASFEPGRPIVELTEIAFGGGMPDAEWGWIQFMVGFDLLFAVASGWVFGRVMID